MKNHRLGILSAILLPASLLCIPGKAQVQDAQFWENLNVSKRLTGDLEARFSHEGRFTDNFSRPSYFFGDFGLGYKVPKTHLGILADYVFIRKLTSEDWWSTRHQFYTALTYRVKWRKFEFHDRQMLLAQVKDLHNSPDGKVPEWYLRNKLTAEYHFNFYWSAYLAEELYWHVNRPRYDTPKCYNRVRCFAGVFFRPDRRNEFELYYLLEQHLNIVNANRNFVIGLGYSLSLG